MHLRTMLRILPVVLLGGSQLVLSALATRSWHWRRLWRRVLAPLGPLLPLLCLSQRS
jgi:hypothetical protein